MKAKPFVIVATLIFAAVFVLHLLRLIYGWEVLIGGFTVPVWYSWVGVIVAALLTLVGLRLSTQD